MALERGQLRQNVVDFLPKERLEANVVLQHHDVLVTVLENLVYIYIILFIFQLSLQVVFFLPKIIVDIVPSAIQYNGSENNRSRPSSSASCGRDPSTLASASRPIPSKCFRSKSWNGNATASYSENRTILDLSLPRHLPTVYSIDTLRQDTQFLEKSLHPSASFRSP